MKTRLSRQRTRLTRDREKKAGKEKARLHRSGFGQHPLWRVGIVLLLWIAAVMLLCDNFFCISFGEEYALLTAKTGPAAFLLLSLMGCALFLDVVNPAVLRNNKHLLLLGILVPLVALFCRLLLYLGGRLDVPEVVTVFFLPIALVPVVCVLLLDPFTATVAGLWTSLIVALMLPYSLEVMLMGMISTAVSVRMVRGVRTRSKVVRAGLITGIVQVGCILGFVFNTEHDIMPTVVLAMAGASIAGGLFAAVISLLILPLFEFAFGITSDLTLFDLSDLGHPLLQRLALEAPGSYHHSLVVANLAQAAAEEVGANGLLARVGAYYHDIGKLIKPQFFYENIRLQDNPHDELPPSMSTLVITAHVKEGISLAMLHKLPGPIKDMIQEHHGTSVLSCFHHKARQQMELGFARTGEKGKLADGDFRYSGPKPHSRETTILSLADPVEAASRTLEKTSPSHLESLVDDIVEQRFEDGQLSESALTMAELTKIKRSFVFTLCNMLHSRVNYPKNNEDKDQQTTPPVQSQQPDNAEIDSQSDDTRIENDAGRSV